MARTLSEGQAWDGVEEIGSGLQASKDAWVREMGRELMAMAAEMRGQLAKGMHTNPLVIYGNPGRGRGPMKVERDVGKVIGPSTVIGMMSPQVYEVRYQHLDDGQDYKHAFDADVQMFATDRAGRHEIMLIHRRGLPLWADFD